VKYLHPFPARMAPDLLDEIFDGVAKKSLVLDPMSGSGSVLTKALAQGHKAVGFDMDPLAVLLSRSVTSSASVAHVEEDLAGVLSLANRSRVTPAGLPWLKGCDDTLTFIDYWFADAQATELARIAIAIDRYKFRSAQSKRLAKVALSKTIITKHRGASLAWDVSHSRPHKVTMKNDFDVFEGFERAGVALVRFMANNRPPTSARVSLSDARQSHLKIEGVDHIVTSPPYLNAIDYLRGHKFSLIWLGYTIPAVRDLRSRTVGAERSSTREISEDARVALKRRLNNVRRLPSKEANFLHRYIVDLDRLIASYKRCLKPKGSLTVVLGNSKLRDVYISSSGIFLELAAMHGFRLKKSFTRRLDPSLRYLPESDRSKQLNKRMKQEVIQHYQLVT
jgi:DNA modification methylase